MKAVIYLRVSTEQQAHSGLGAAGQEAACRSHCERMHWEITAVERDDGISGKNELEDRPGLARAVARAKMRKDVTIVVYSLSRLSRRQRLTWMLLDERGEYRLQIASASEPFETVTPIGRAMLGMLAVWAQLEADMSSERTRCAIAAKRARGERVGMIPTREQDPSLCVIVREAFARARSWNGAAKALNDAGVKSRHGKAWYAASVRDCLR